MHDFSAPPPWALAGDTNLTIYLDDRIVSRQWTLRDDLVAS